MRSCYPVAVHAQPTCPSVPSEALSSIASWTKEWDGEHKANSLLPEPGLPQEDTFHSGGVQLPTLHPSLPFPKKDECHSPRKDSSKGRHTARFHNFKPGGPRRLLSLSISTNNFFYIGNIWPKLVLCPLFGNRLCISASKCDYGMKHLPWQVKLACSLFQMIFFLPMLTLFKERPPHLQLKL